MNNYRSIAIVSIDISEAAQQKAKQRCQNLNNVRFKIIRLPQEYPDEMFDPIVLSEAGYYFCWEDLHRVQQLIIDRLQFDGHLLLVYWTPKAESYPLTGDEVHESFLKLLSLKNLKGLWKEQYRLNLFERI